MGCPCANPPGTGKFKPIKVPRPRTAQPKSTPKMDEKEPKNDENTPVSSDTKNLNRKQYIDLKHIDTNQKMFQNALINNHSNVLKKKRLSGFLSR